MLLMCHNKDRLHAQCSRQREGFFPLVSDLCEESLENCRREYRQNEMGGSDLVNLTAKELTALEDQIGHEQTLVKKYQAMAQLCNKTEIQNSLSSIAQKHQEHCNQLMTFLQ